MDLDRRAAEQDDPHAQCIQGFCFLHGIGTDPDPIQAVKWLERAAAKGHPRAQRLLADCLRTGRGTQLDPKRAAALYGRAAERGDKAAAEALRQLKAEGGKKGGLRGLLERFRGR